MIIKRINLGYCYRSGQFILGLTVGQNRHSRRNYHLPYAMLPVRGFIVFGLVFVIEISALPTSYTAREQNATTEGSPKDKTLHLPSTESTAEKLARLSQCSLKPVSPTLTSEIQEKLDDGARLIHMYLTIVNHTGPFPGEDIPTCSNLSDGPVAPEQWDAAS